MIMTFSDFIPAIILVSSLIIIILLVYLYIGQDEKRDARQMKKRTITRERITEHLNEVEDSLKEYQLERHTHKEAITLQSTINEMRSLLRDGRRSTDKVESLDDKLEGQVEEFKKSII